MSLPGKTIWLCLTMLALAATPVIAQEPPTAPTSEIVKINTDLVVLDAQVLRKKDGKVISTLSRDDFVLLEDGVKQDVVHFSQDRLPLSILLLLDLSASVRPVIQEIRNGALQALQHLRPEEIKRFASQRVIASMQPYHAIDDGRWAENRIGAERAKGTYAFRSLLDAGAVLAFGSDWFVAPMEPLMGIYGAVTRRTLDGKRPSGWVPEQKITVAEAVKAFTLGAAFASFDETVKGSIEVGKLADFAVLSADIFNINPVEIEKAKVVMTIFDGRVIFERQPEPKR